VVVSTLPGLAILVVVMGFNLLATHPGRLDPRQRQA